MSNQLDHWWSNVQCPFQVPGAKMLKSSCEVKLKASTLKYICSFFVPEVYISFFNPNFNFVGVLSFMNWKTIWVSEILQIGR
jgi:hypothetical protein